MYFSEINVQTSSRIRYCGLCGRVFSRRARVQPQMVSFGLVHVFIRGGSCFDLVLYSLCGVGDYALIRRLKSILSSTHRPSFLMHLLKSNISNNHNSNSNTMKMAFESEPGVIAPTGFWDPFGLAKNIDDATFAKYRTAELKHGRVAMLAVTGLITAAYARFPGGIGCVTND